LKFLLKIFFCNYRNIVEYQIVNTDVTGMNNAESNTDSDSCNKVYIISINNYNNSDSIINIE